MIPTSPHRTDPSIPEALIQLGKKARAAAMANATATPVDRDTAIQRMLEALRAAREPILQANQIDVARAEAKGMAAPLLKRLTLTKASLESMERRLQAISEQSDPVGRMRLDQTMPSGLHVQQVTTPLAPS